VKNFEKDKRKIQELKGRPIAENIYRQIFGNNTTIKRFEREEEFILDKHFAIDIELGLTSGQILLGQEKFLSNMFIRFGTITVEYMQNPKINEQGDWFKLCPQFYFVGYFNRQETDFELWVMADWCKMVVETLKNNIRWITTSNKNGRARANFKACKMRELPDGCILYSSFNNIDKIIRTPLQQSLF